MLVSSSARALILLASVSFTISSLKKKQLIQSADGEMQAPGSTQTPSMSQSPTGQTPIGGLPASQSPSGQTQSPDAPIGKLVSSANFVELSLMAVFAMLALLV
jgi:hypothetical protein